MAELRPVLGRLRLLHYHDRFVDEGFETWDQRCDITEADLKALNVGLGHRRRLQREIANALRPSDQRPSVEVSPSISDGDLSIWGSNITKANDSGAERVKRKYRRRPKADMNAPKKPLSAYVLYANGIRESLRQKNLSFADGAKVTVEQWHVLDPTEKEWWKSEAIEAKKVYDANMAAYKKTRKFNDHKAYVDFFKSGRAAKTGQKEQRPQPVQPPVWPVDGVHPDSPSSCRSTRTTVRNPGEPPTESGEQFCLVNGIWAL